ncbi:MAG: hypothetical protein FWF90_09230 [Promicromonosporaceae bacterium]|nr:hypothetical protein [Promicromonosporaceae bacterium]
MPHPIDAGKDILFFQCANDPGMCDEWDQKAGGNAAIVVAAGAESYAVPPAEGITSLHGHWSGHVVAADADTYDQARADSRGDGLAVLGCLGGEPGWIQDDETPTCSACGQPMILAAQLEESADRNSFNFGGAGCGYIFACTCPGGTASFLWQC